MKHNKTKPLDRVKLSTLLASIMGMVLSVNYLFKLGLANK